MAQEIITGGFPILLFPSENRENLQNVAKKAMAILLEDEDDKLILGDEIVQDDLKHLERLPKLFALLHFHAEYLKQSKKVGVLAHDNNFHGKEEAVFLWLEVDGTGRIFLAGKNLENGYVWKNYTEYGVMIH